jgi:hypothetical protein
MKMTVKEFYSKASVIDQYRSPIQKEQQLLQLCREFLDMKMPQRFYMHDFAEKPHTRACVLVGDIEGWFENEKI